MIPSTTGRPAPDGVPPLRVLCVDDNHDVADTTATLLEVTGFEARACYDGDTALTEAANFSPGACLIDLNMPGMNGDVLAVRLRELVHGEPLLLVAMTAMSDEGSCCRIKQAGFDLHLVKPVDPYKLVSVLDALCKVWSDSGSSSHQDATSGNGKRLQEQFATAESP